MFLQRGYRGTSIDEIATRAAVSKPTVYRFFDDKEHLLTEIVLGTLDRRGDPFRAKLAALVDTGDLGSDLPNLARDYIRVVTQPAGLALRRLVIGASHQLPELAQAYYERAQDQTLGALAGLPMTIKDGFDVENMPALSGNPALKDRAKLKAGETLLVLGAGGGVGIAAVELGKAMGARVIAAASSQAKVDVAIAHGADAGLVYPQGPFDKDGARALTANNRSH